MWYMYVLGISCQSALLGHFLGLLFSDERYHLLWLATWNPPPLNLGLPVVYSQQGMPVETILTLQMVLLVNNYFKTIFLWYLQLVPTNHASLPLRTWEIWALSKTGMSPLWPQAVPTQPLAPALTFSDMNEEPVPMVSTKKTCSRKNEHFS